MGLYHDQFTFFIQAAVSDFGFRSSEVLSLGFWSKMILNKLISELSIRELKTVFVRTCRRGVFLESSAIIQLTIFLVRIGQDPFTYRFPISVPDVSKSNASVVKEAEVSNYDVVDVKNLS